MYRLFINQNQKDDHHISLSSEQEHYLRRVLRLKIGERFVAMDGKGSCWLVELTATGGEIIEVVSNNNELSVAVTLMVALPKSNGFDEIVRCATELGVNQFMPVISARTIIKPKENKLQRWGKIAIEAAEQSERVIVPYIFEPMSFDEAITEINKLNAYCYLAATRKEVSSLWENLQHIPKLTSNHILIATGPEGGWTDEEVEKAIANGFKVVSLGKRILRAITAPIMAMSIVVGIYDN